MHANSNSLANRRLGPILLTGLPLSLFLACNAPPSAPKVSIGPISPHTEDDLVAIIDGDSDDDQGNKVSYSYAWKQDGLPRNDITGDTVPASETAKGQVWAVSVTPNDGKVDGPAGRASTTIVNSLPVVDVTLSPEVPTTLDDLVVIPEATDADGDPVTFSFSWTLDGGRTDVDVDTISADQTAHGQRWAVTVTPNDSEKDGTPVTAEVEIADAAPVMLAVSIVPAEPYVLDDLVATVEASDADGDAITFQYAWFVDGSLVQSGVSDTLAAGSFAKHQRVTVEVTPKDGFIDGEPLSSVDAIVMNSIPTADGVSIDPSNPYEATTLTCLPVGFSDADGDPEAWSFVWQVNGTEVSFAVTLDGANFSKGDTITCAATPFDGEESGVAVASVPIIIANTPPVLNSVALSTLTPTENDTITVTLGAASDDDDDAITFGYAWSVNGAVVSTSDSLPPGRFNKGDSIYVTVTPWDGTDFGAPVTSAAATGTNLAPSISAVSLSPADIYTNDTLSAAVTATDLDGDPIFFSYDWYVDGFPRGSSSSASLSGVAYFDKGQAVYVVVTPTDGVAIGATATSSTVTVLNSAPTAPVVEITPSDATEGDDLTCTVTSASTDADGDLVTYSFDWGVDGAAYSGAVDTTTTSVVDGADVGASEIWSCDATSSDEFDSTLGVTAQIFTTSDCASLVFVNGSATATNGQIAPFNFARTDSFTVSWWGFAPTGSYGAYFVKGTSTSDKGIGDWSISNGVDGLIHFANQDVSQLSFAETKDKWVHRTFSYSNGSVNYYEDGVLSGTGSKPFSGASGKALSVGGLLGYGSGANSYMADVAIWGTALSPAMVAAIATGSAQPDDFSDLRAWWPMGEGTGTTTKDLSVYAADLQLSAYVSWSTSVCP